MIESVNVIGSGRVGSAVSARLAERGVVARRRLTRPRAALRARPGDRRGRRRDRAGAVGRARERGHPTRRARSAFPALRRPPVCRRSRCVGGRSSSTAPGPRSRPRATTRASPGRGSRRRSGCARFPCATRSRRLPRRGRDRLQLPRHAAPRRGSAARSGGSATRGARSSDGEDDRERLRAHRPDRARRLGDGRPPSGGDPDDPSRSRSDVPRARRRDGGVRMKVCRTIADIRAALEPCRDGTIGLVPTMGALHAGHLSLLAAARAECSTVVMSLFVNPAQFGNPGDLNGYPRDETRDLAAAAEAGVDLVFAPDCGRDVSGGVPDLGRGDRASEPCSKGSIDRGTSAVSRRSASSSSTSSAPTSSISARRTHSRSRCYDS